MTGVTAFQLLGKLAIDGVDETKKALDDVAKNGEDAKNKLNVSFQDIGNKAGELGQKMAKGLSVGLAGITASYEATKEFRMDLGRLEAGYQGVGMSGDTANKVFKDMYGILGETDTAVEASNLLKELVQDEQGLAEWTTIATGVYARFPDSIPIESLIEASNETAKVGQVTGTLADALNWAGVSEEQFNEKLEKCNTEAEREALIRDTLNGLYKDSATEYNKNNKGIIDNNKAQADLNMKMAETMEKIEPLITQGKIFIAEVLMKLQPAITWIIDNINILAPIVLGFIGSLFALNIASKIIAFIPILKTLFTVIQTNPIILVITLIIGAIALLIANWDKVKEVTLKVWEAMKQAVKTAVTAIKNAITTAFNAVKTFITNTFNSIKKVASTVWNAIKSAITTVINSIKNTITKVFNTIKNTVSNVFNSIKNVASNVWDGIKTKISNVVNTIKNTVSTAFNTIKNNVSNIFNGMKNIISNIWGGVVGIIKAPINTIIGLINGFIKGLNKVKVPDWVPGVGGKGINIPLIPKLEQGGILEKGQIGLLEGNGAEAVVPLHNNKKWISKVADDMGNAIGTGDNNKIENKLDKVINLLTNYLQVMKNQQVVLSTGELVGAMVSPLDRALGQLADDRRRGR